ncbi:MAG TPA: protein kinase, partial [Candidatus Bathyarchaeia archaeon]|nr:protein kinase [Candidatus Bathyarchaeia archaeon]
MIGKTISHYLILDKLGEGGMGVVYKAEDTKLDRLVAIKVLPQNLSGDAEAKSRFVQEAKAASFLDHVNICTVYEIDEMPDGRIFMAMAFYDGRTVQEHLAGGPLDIGRSVDIAIGVARGLARAHEGGIVHRDIKPANIMATRDGVVKIMDFGIAKLAGQATITRAGSSPGTAAYMSPEQARGGAVDHRTDIWSLGVVLYEMLTGQRPFGGEYDQAVIYSVLHESPVAPATLSRDIPADLERIVMKALAKAPAERFQTAAQMLAVLEACARSIAAGAENVSSQTRSDRGLLPSIVVLPFKDMSPQQDQEYFCEGIAEELTNALVQIEGVRVAARPSSEQFKGKGLDVRAMGRELGVQSVLEGSVRTAGGRLRITAQLIDVEDGYHLFSEKYDRTPEDIFAIQDEISLAIVDKLKVRLLKGEESKLKKRHTVNEEAYRLYLQGRYFWNRKHEGGIQRGIEFFRKAIAADPEYALPYAGLADCYLVLGWYGFLAPGEAFEKCRETALKALTKDPDLAEAHASLGAVISFFDRNWPGGETELRLAVRLNPSYGVALQFYSNLLAALGRFDEAVAEQARAMEVDPVQPAPRVARVFTLRLAGRHDAALAEASALTEEEPNFWPGWLMLGHACAEVGRFADAQDALRKADDLTGGTSSHILGATGLVLGRAGKREEARLVLNR